MLSIERKDLILEPFPHIIKENIVDSAVFKELSSSFPDENIFHQSKNYQWGGGRINLVKGMPHYEKFIKESPVWKNFYDYINGKKFVEKILSIFGEQISINEGELNLKNWKFSNYAEPLYLSASGPMTKMQYYLKRTGIGDILDSLLRLCMRDELYITFDIAMSKTGYHIPVHTDNRYKLIYMLIYFNNQVSDEGGELLLHKHKNIRALREFPRYPGEENTVVIKRLLPQKNLGVIGLNCNNSYHSTTPYSSNEARKFLYISICKRYTDSLWLSESFQSVHTDSRGFGEKLGI